MGSTLHLRTTTFAIATGFGDPEPIHGRHRPTKRAIPFDAGRFRLQSPLGLVSREGKTVRQNAKHQATRDPLLNLGIADIASISSHRTRCLSGEKGRDHLRNRSRSFCS